MKTKSNTTRRAAPLHQTPARQAANPVAAALLIIGLTGMRLHAGPTNATPNPSATTNAITKTEPTFAVQSPYIEPAVPEAIFTMPKGPADGKDPFYPASTSPYGEPIKINTQSGPAPIVAELILRGISGSDEKPLAIINTTTFGPDDELDVTTKAGKLRIRCLEINKADGTATVQIGGEKRLLRLPTTTLPPPK